MAIRRPPRLELNRHGVFTLRLVVPLAYRDSLGRPREIRVSLRTRDPMQARVLALQLNAQIERFRLESPGADPRTVLQPWQTTAPARYPTTSSTPCPDFPVCEPHVTGQVDAQTPLVSAAPVLPPPLRKLSAAIEAFIRSRGGLANNRRNTGAEKQRALGMLTQFLRDRGIDTAKVAPGTITRSMLIDFVESYAVREGKSGTPALSARTVLKQVGHLKEFFEYLVGHNDLPTSPIDAHFDRAIAGLRSRASHLKGRRNYLPFSDADIKLIFEPRRFLEHNSAADDFWVPLLALYTGARLGELVVLTIDDVIPDPRSGVIVLQVSGKNENSRRAVPLAQALVDLGFIAYVEHVRRLGGTSLFPHRPTNVTRQADPSKHVSRAFGEHLDRVGLNHPLQVFHSLRHTVISRMHVCGVPVGDAELVVGHAAQDAALRSDTARSHLGRSMVHLGTYAHPEAYTVGDESVIARLKRRLDESLTFAVDLERLARAAAIVQEHTRLDSRRQQRGECRTFRSGWHTNAQATAAREVGRLDQ